MNEDRQVDKAKKIEDEISRSLSVVKMKEAHKKIEDIERQRKLASIKSICERITYCDARCENLVKNFRRVSERPGGFPNTEIGGDTELGRLLRDTISMYESIVFDFEKTIDIKREDFEKLFPKIDFVFGTFKSGLPTLIRLRDRLVDMKNYCSRFLL